LTAKEGIGMPNLMRIMLERRDELRAELNALPEFREYELLESFIRQYESLAEPQAGSERPERRRRSSGFTVTDAAAAAIEDVGRPVPLQELTEALPRYGKTVTGKRPAINLSSALSRDKRFASVHWRGVNAWWFRDRELPSDADASGGGAADAPAASSDDDELMEVERAAA
jgi:hypothetical protein